MWCSWVTRHCNKCGNGNHHNDKQNHTNETEPVHETADEDLLSLFDQYSELMSPTLDWLSTDIATVMNETSLEGISATYHITVQQCTTTAMFDMVPACQSYHKKFLTLYHNVTKDKYKYSNFSYLHWRRTDRTCYLTFKLGNKNFMDKFIVLQDLWRDLLLP